MRVIGWAVSIGVLHYPQHTHTDLKITHSAQVDNIVEFVIIIITIKARSTKERFVKPTM